MPPEITAIYNNYYLTPGSKQQPGVKLKVLVILMTQISFKELVHRSGFLFPDRFLER